jgi:hypothetical protein
MPTCGEIALDMLLFLSPLRMISYLVRPLVRRPAVRLCLISGLGLPPPHHRAERHRPERITRRLGPTILTRMHNADQTTYDNKSGSSAEWHRLSLKGEVMGSFER